MATKTSIEKLSYEIGYDIGMSDDLAQQKLLNGLFEALHDSMDEYHLNSQICYIVKGLSGKSTKLINTINEFINLKEQE